MQAASETRTITRARAKTVVPRRQANCWSGGRESGVARGDMTGRPLLGTPGHTERRPTEKLRGQCKNSFKECGSRGEADT